jgi:hypothetical protein
MLKGERRMQLSCLRSGQHLHDENVLPPLPTPSSMLSCILFWSPITFLRGVVCEDAALNNFKLYQIYRQLLMMKITLAALLSLQAASGFAPSAQYARPSFGLHMVTTGPKGKPAASAEEDLMLTLKVIMDHQERSTTVSKDQYISQVEESKKVEEEKPEPIDVSIPYDAAAKLAYEKSDKSMAFDAFKEKYEADAVADVIAKNAPAVDLSIPYDAAAKLAYEKSDKSMAFEAFKEKYEADAVADVIAKNAPAVDLSIPYDAAAKLAYEKSDKSMTFDAFKAKYEEDAVADVVAKQKQPVAA